MGSELVQLASFYAAPSLVLLARVDGAAAGCVALRVLDRHRGEVRRLYVLPQLRSSGLGRRLMDRLLVEARDRRLGQVVLTTLPTMTHAGALYRQYGFLPIEPYANPTDGVLSYGLDL